MATRNFNLMNGGIRYGNTLRTSTAGYFPGQFVKLDTTGSTVTLSGSSGGSNKPFGFLFGDRTLTYAPTTRVYAVGDQVSVVFGVGVVSMSVDLFDEAALPTTPGTTIYAAASGLWTANVTSNKVGTYIQTAVRYEPVGGIGLSQNLAVVQFSILP